METNKLLFSVFVLLLTMGSCRYASNKSISTNDSITIDNSIINTCLVERLDTCSLIVLYPKFSRVDLVCETMPSKDDNSVLLCAEAAFTGMDYKKFAHANIAGNHVSNGNWYNGYSCERNTGAFVFYNHRWEFLYKDYSSEMKTASENGGAAFGQEMIIHNGKLVQTIREDSNINQFRALCQIGDRLCIVESSKKMTFGEFKTDLVKINAEEALYLDMGAGWNYAWYRTDDGSAVELNPKTHDYCTNWITFYK